MVPGASMPATTSMLHLPLEILAEIFSYVTRREAVGAKASCRILRDVCRSLESEDPGSKLHHRLRLMVACSSTAEVVEFSFRGQTPPKRVAVGRAWAKSDKVKRSQRATGRGLRASRCAGTGCTVSATTSKARWSWTARRSSTSACTFRPRRNGRTSTRATSDHGTCRTTNGRSKDPRESRAPATRCTPPSRTARSGAYTSTKKRHACQSPSPFVGSNDSAAISCRCGREPTRFTLFANPRRRPAREGTPKSTRGSETSTTRFGTSITHPRLGNNAGRAGATST